MKNILLSIFIATSVIRTQAQANNANEWTNINFTRLFSFDETNGAEPFAGLTMGKGGTFYGTTFYGGTYDRGTIFKITPNGKLTTLFSFNGTNGFGVEGELVQGDDGNLYGTTRHGGNGYDTLHQFGAGTIFRINTDGDEFTNLYFFPLMGEPVGGLVSGSDGNFYGVTQWGGKGSEGTIFRISLDGNFKIVISLDDKTGANPNGNLILGRDGKMYGTMGFGGNYYTGDFFSITTNGVFTVLASFNETNNIRVFRNKLLQGRDGDFYGTTEFGGAYDSKIEDGDGIGDGTLFKVTTNGFATTLASFNGLNGAHPRGELIQTSDGSFYGVTVGGIASQGTIFRATTNGNIITLFRFRGPNFEYVNTNGCAPCGLAVNSDGIFYGTTILGGEKAHMAGYASGTIFRFSISPTKPVAK